VLLESKQRVDECAYVEARYNHTARSRTETQGIPQCRSRRAHQRMGRVAETFPLGVLVHLLKEFQVANRQKQYRHEGRGSGDRERRKERMPAEVHVHLTNLRRGAQYNPDRIHEIPGMPPSTVPSMWVYGVPPACAARGEASDARSPNDRHFSGWVTNVEISGGGIILVREGKYRLRHTVEERCVYAHPIKLTTNYG
jgi:hypothetical protein